MTQKRIAIAILAGGEGSRIGGKKPSVELSAMSLLERAVEKAARWSDEVRLVVRSPKQLSFPGLPQLVDVPNIEGPLGGLAAGLNWANVVGAELLMTIPCDMPFLPDDLARRLVDSLGSSPAAIAASNDRLHPVCGLWRSDLNRLVEGYASTGKRSLKGFAQHVGFVQVDWIAEPVDPFFNINTPTDLQSARSILEN
jgi:molybdopterin-guanine dinucleotide biosynthesis protein A